MALKQILGQVLQDVLIRKFRGTSLAPLWRISKAATPESGIGSILENILPGELGQYWKSQYWPSSTGSIFSRIAPVDNSGVGVMKVN